MPVKILVGDLKPGKKISYFGEVLVVEKVTFIKNKNEVQVKVKNETKPLFFPKDFFIELAW